MKKIIYLSLAGLFAALLISSCAKENSVNEPKVEEGIKVTINAGKAEMNPATKTEMFEGSPYWSVGDVIGVSDGESSNAAFNTSIAERATTASFSGTVDAAGDYYAYYPYTSNDVGKIGDNWGAKFDMPVNQNPTATSFDGAADIMVSKKFTVSETTPTVNNLEFARLGAIVKIVLIDTEAIMNSQHPSTVSMTAESNLAGRVLINMKDQRLEDPYYNASHTVTANYTSLTQYEINGANATYLIVAPQTLAEGSTLTIAASTEGYSIKKDITIPSGGIALEKGKITTLNINLTSSHITTSSGLALPFNDNFSWQDGTGSNGLNFETTPAIPSTKYSAFAWVYQGGATDVIRVSKSSGTGYLTTVALDLSSAFYVHINSKYWSDQDATHLLVSVDDDTPEDIALTGNYDDYYVNFAAATSKSKVKITTTENKRAYIKAFDIISGTYVVPPVINVTSDNPMVIANTAGSKTITYTISNPTAATLTASLKNPLDTWISNINYSTSGEVTFDVSAQGAEDPSRSAVIVLSYTGAPNVEVTINQAAGSSGITKGDTKVYTISNSTTNSQSFNRLIGNSSSSGNFDHASSKSITLDGHSWTISTTGNGSVIYAQGYQLGAGDKNNTKRDVTGVTMSTSAYVGGIETITVTSTTNGSATLAVYVGGVQVETAKTVGSNVTYTLTSIATGTITLEWTQSTAGKNLTIQSIRIN